MSSNERFTTFASKKSIILEAISAFARKELSLIVNNVENKPLIVCQDAVHIYVVWGWDFPCVKK